MSELEAYLKIRKATLWLRLGLIFVFSYVPVASTLNPSLYYHYLPQWLTRFIEPNLALHLLTFVEIVLVCWLVWGKFLRYAGLFSALLLIPIIGFNFPLLSVTFRNVAIVAMSFSLMYLAE